jgi:hypothetical protein
MSKGAVSIAVVILCLALASGVGAQAIVVDHRCVDLSAIPDEYVSWAAAERVLLRHASVGQGIGWGLDCLAGQHPTNSVCPDVPAGRYDRSNWVLEARAGNWRDKMEDLVSQAASRNTDFDVLMMKFCYIDALGSSHPDWEYCRSRMEQLETDYPDKTLVWWTIPLTRDGQAGTDVFNAQVRSYCAAHHKILFDVADVECHDPDGTKLTNGQGNEVISQNYTKEIHAGHLNPEGRVRVASALWHLMARIAGWDPNASPPTLPDPNAGEGLGSRGIFVDAAGGRDDNNGLTPATALATIQRGIDMAQDGDAVVVSPGLYEEDVRFGGRNITLTSLKPARSDVVSRTVIDGTVYFRGTEDANCALAGFRIDGAIVGFDPQLDPNGVHHTRATIRHCVLENIISGCGGVIRNCDGMISHCVIANIGYLCRRAWPVSGIVGCHGLIRNCTIVEAADGMEILEGGACTIENCIIYHGSAMIVREGGTLTVSYSDVEGGQSGVFGTGTVNWGPDNIDVWPCFARLGHEQEAGDYHLKSAAGRWDPEWQRWVQDDVASTCIDAADPASDWTAELWPHGQRTNMGAYGGTAEASMSLSGFGSVADLDRNGAVDAADLSLLIGQWLIEDVLLAEDTNRDGFVDLRDLVRLGQAWGTSAGPVLVPSELLLGH